VASARSYRLGAGEPLPDGIGRIALGRIDHALDELRGKNGSSPEDAVHEARKDMKKMRSLLRLARGELGESVFARENVFFRDTARELAAVRDDDVLLETLGKLDLPPGEGWEIRKLVQAHRAEGGDGRETAVRGVVTMLQEARGRVSEWPLERDSFEAIADGLERTYRRGRRELRGARSEPSVEALHEWRKRVKHLWYHHTILRRLWPPAMTAFAEEAHELSNLLGDDHDLAMVAAWVRAHADGSPQFFNAVDRRRAALEADALLLGERLYAEKPSAYVRRLGRLWKAAAATATPSAPASQ
jgi:CHAD domain-containing protein